MRRFKWIEWNLRKIGDHGLSAAEDDEVPDIFFDEVSEVPIFVITAY